MLTILFISYIQKIMKGQNIKPLFDYVLIKPLEAETKTASGILLPDSAKEKPQVGQVMAIGSGKKGCCDDKECECEKMLVKKGDKVLYKKWAGNEVKVDREEWLLVEQKDIMAIVE